MADLLLLSGGIDSAAIAAWRLPDACLTIDYGQKAADAEVAASQQICADLKISHAAMRVPLGALGSGLMAGAPRSGSSTHDEHWPYRNQMLLTLGAMYAVKHGYSQVLLGTVSTDGERHIDGSAAFVDAIAALVGSQEGALAISAPAIALTTTQLISVSGITPQVLGWTHSCHTSAVACGHCPGCDKHSNVMESLGWHR